jgi:hypothetical protein
MSDKKYSVYLQQKCETLQQALSFFTDGGNQSMPGSEKRVNFLAQIDFWDWEIANLIFSFTNFEERSKAWLDYAAVTAMLQRNNLLVKNDILAKTYSAWKGERTPIIAPINDLNKVIDIWNGLISLCIKNVVDKSSIPVLQIYYKEKLNEITS